MHGIFIYLYISISFYIYIYIYRYLRHLYVFWVNIPYREHMGMIVLTCVFLLGVQRGVNHVETCNLRFSKWPGSIDQVWGELVQDEMNCHHCMSMDIPGTVYTWLVVTGT